MITWRCVQKLLQRLGAKPEAARTAPTNALDGTPTWSQTIRHCDATVLIKCKA